MTQLLLFRALLLAALAVPSQQNMQSTSDIYSIEFFDSTLSINNLGGAILGTVRVRSPSQYHGDSVQCSTRLTPLSRRRRCLVVLLRQPGLGPEDSDLDIMLYTGMGDVDGQPLALRLRNLTTYEGKTGSNGIIDAFGQVNVVAGSDVLLEVCMVHEETQELFPLEAFCFTFFDLDQGANGGTVETVSMFQDEFSEYFLHDEDTEIAVEVDEEAGETIFSATTSGNKNDNPSDPMDLSPEQLARCVTFVFEDTACFRTRLAVGSNSQQPPNVGRNFLFAGISQLMFNIPFSPPPPPPQPPSPPPPPVPPPPQSPPPPSPPPPPPPPSPHPPPPPPPPPSPPSPATPAPLSTPTPVPVPTPMPVPAQMPMPVPAQIPMPVPTPAPMTMSMPIPMPLPVPMSDDDSDGGGGSGPPPSICEDACGEFLQDMDCGCDAPCALLNDCCEDYPVFCEPGDWELMNDLFGLEASFEGVCLTTVNVQCDLQTGEVIYIHLTRFVGEDDVDLPAGVSFSQLIEALADEMSDSLQEFIASHLQLEGSIPSAFGMFDNLQVLDLSHNQLEGNIQVIRDLATSMRVILLNNNNFEGYVPNTNLNNLDLLEVFIVSHNNLLGGINGFAGMQNLRELRAEDNLLDGEIPSFASQAEDLRLVLNRNRLVGSLEDVASSSTTVHLEIAGNNCICGGEVPAALEVQSIYATNLGMVCDPNDPCTMGTGIAEEDNSPLGQLDRETLQELITGINEMLNIESVAFNGQELGDLTQAQLEAIDMVLELLQDNTVEEAIASATRMSFWQRFSNNVIDANLVSAFGGFYLTSTDGMADGVVIKQCSVDFGRDSTLVALRSYLFDVLILSGVDMSAAEVFLNIVDVEELNELSASQAQSSDCEEDEGEIPSGFSRSLLGSDGSNAQTASSFDIVITDPDAAQALTGLQSIDYFNHPFYQNGGGRKLLRLLPHSRRLSQFFTLPITTFAANFATAVPTTVSPFPGGFGRKLSSSGDDDSEVEGSVSVVCSTENQILQILEDAGLQVAGLNHRSITVDVDIFAACDLPVQCALEEEQLDLLPICEPMVEMPVSPPPAPFDDSDCPPAFVDPSVCEGADNVICGTEDADVIYGTAGRDCIFGFMGSDTIYGLAGDDVIYGGAGSDVIYGNLGDDTVYGEAGSDLLFGGLGKDVAFGGSDEDTIFGGPGGDSLFGGVASDLLYGGDGDDHLYGGNKGDAMFGGPGADMLYGGNGYDSLYGDDGNDVLLGQGGKDTVWGGLGVDTLFGGQHKDLLVAGGGGDSSGPNLLMGGASKDVLVGTFAGPTQFVGGDAADTFYTCGNPDVQIAAEELAQEFVFTGAGDSPLCS